MVEHDVQKVLLRLMYAILKLMVDLNESLIVIMAIVNCDLLGSCDSITTNTKIQTKTNFKYTTRSKATQFPFILHLVASLRSLTFFIYISITL